MHGEDVIAYDGEDTDAFLLGLLGSWATLPFFPGLLNLPGWIPLFYGVADTVLQGVFCLGASHDDCSSPL